MNVADSAYHAPIRVSPQKARIVKTFCLKRYATKTFELLQAIPCFLIAANSYMA